MTDQQLKYQVQESDSGRVDVVVARLAQLSRARVRGLVDFGGVVINGVTATDAGAMIAAGDELQVRFDPVRRYKEKPQVRPTRGFSIVHLDEHLVVVHKEAGLLTVPTDKREDHTLIALISRHLHPGQKRGGQIHVVHRLDRDTSGLLVFGRSAKVAASLIAQFAAHKPERSYAAIVAGVLSLDSDEIRSYLRSDASLNQKSAATGELAITHYKVEQRYRDATLLTVTLTTGRRNQVRVHMAELGHPVLGDRRYQAERAAHPRWPYPRLALHAEKLGFRHPVTKEALSFLAPRPSEFARFK